MVEVVVRCEVHAHIILADGSSLKIYSQQNSTESKALLKVSHCSQVYNKLWLKRIYLLYESNYNTKKEI